MASVTKSHPVTSHLKRLPSTTNSAGRCAAKDRRGEARHSIGTDAGIQDCAQSSSAAMIQDISIQGCNIRGVPCDIGVGQYVVIRLAGLSMIGPFSSR